MPVGPCVTLTTVLIGFFAFAAIYHFVFHHQLGVIDPLAFIAKPFTTRDLTSKVREALEGKDPPSPDRL